jgi:hypothetical protein
LVVAKSVGHGQQLLETGFLLEVITVVGELLVYIIGEALVHCVLVLFSDLSLVVFNLTVP